MASSSTSQFKKGGLTSSSSSNGSFPRLSLRALLFSGTFQRRSKQKKSSSTEGKQSSEDVSSLKGDSNGRKKSSIKRGGINSKRPSQLSKLKTNSTSISDGTPHQDNSTSASVDLSHHSCPNSSSRVSVSTLHESHGGTQSVFSEPGPSTSDNQEPIYPLFNRTNSNSSNTSAVSNSNIAVNGLRECILCLQELPLDHFPKISTCSHSACLPCFRKYLKIEITESRTHITCPKCSEMMHPTDIHHLINNPLLSYKFEDFMLRRVLSMDPDTRWCPAPDCGYAIIASGCAGCPKLTCERPGCGTMFCYHCKAEWHPHQTCDMARGQRMSHFLYRFTPHEDDKVKACPRCQMMIVKMDDGSCNHMTCSVCGAEFCWLCMKEVSDLHYLSPSGCTFWGKKPWSRRKKVLWQLGTLIGAPLGIGLLAGLAVPAIIIGVPIWVWKKIHSKYRSANKHKRNSMIVCGVMCGTVVSPLLAAVAVSIGVPILLAYVYGVVPISLCRSGGCGVITSASGVRIAFDDETEAATGGASSSSNSKVANPTATAAASAIFGPSGAAALRGLAKLELGDSSGSSSDPSGGNEGVLTGGSDPDRESASNVAIAPPSLAGSIASGYTTRPNKLQVPVEVETEHLVSSQPETVSLAVSERSTNTLDTENASTRALNNYKIDGRSEGSSLSSMTTAHSQPVAHAGDSASTVLENVGDSVSTMECPHPGGVSMLSSISANTSTNLYYPSAPVYNEEQPGSKKGELVEYEGQVPNPRHMDGSDPRLDSVSAIIIARKMSAHAKGVTFSIGSSHSRDHISINLEEDNRDSESTASLSGVSNSAVSAAAVSNVSSNTGARSVSRNIVMASDDECCLDGCSYNNDNGSVGSKSLQHQPLPETDSATEEVTKEETADCALKSNYLCRSEGYRLNHISESRGADETSCRNGRTDSLASLQLSIL